MEKRHPLRPRRQRFNGVIAKSPRPGIARTKDAEIRMDQYRPCWVIARLKTLNEVDPSGLVGKTGPL